MAGDDEVRPHVHEAAVIDATRALTLVERLTGTPPYEWQQRLLCDWFAAGRTPAAVDIPTGLGKTRVMALWLAARALGAALPRRLVYVVDRRAVVDQATLEAGHLECRLPKALDGLGEDVATGCRDQLGLAKEKVPVSTLRGQFADNRRWLDSPGGAAIIVGTVDMIGSRLLFEGYGVGMGMRPAHAGLLGADTLFLIDEAHLVRPFEALLRSVAGFDRPAPVPAMHVMALSATGGKQEEEAVFRLEPQDYEDPAVRKRLDARKHLRLHETPELVEAMAAQAIARGEGGRRVIVFCNQRDKGAREVEQKIQELARKKWKGQVVTGLLVGARRGLEREADPGGVLERFMPGEARSETEIPAFLVATSAGEVGIDLDADHMVCDLVAWERMVQRLGRVNRTGRAEPAMVDVFWSRALGKTMKEDAEDAVEDKLAVLRAPFESPLWPVEEDGSRLAGPGALLALKRDRDFVTLTDQATTPEPLRPALTGPLVEAWAMTSLEEHPGRPRVEPWLRGWVDSPPQTRVVWRRVLLLRDGERPNKPLLNAFFEEFPPHLTEVLEADSFAVAALLKTRVAAVLKARAALKTGAKEGPWKAQAAVVLSQRNKVVEVLSREQLEQADTKRLANRLAGQVVVLDAELGGLSEQGLLDPKEAKAPSVLDAAEPPSDGSPGWSEDWLERVGRRLRRVRLSTPPRRGWIRQEGWPVESGGEDAFDDEATADEDAAADSDDAPGWEWRVEKLARNVETGNSARTSRKQELSVHHNATAVAAAGIAAALSLDEAQRQMLGLVAAVHDKGKARDLWQTAMGADKGGRPYAKTAGQGVNTRLLEGYRHEFGSLCDAEGDLGVIADPDLRDLARHLIAAHHGRARPVIEPFDPDEPPSASDARAREAALRFARLQRRWGPWGLAWWESLLRAADWAASRQLEQEASGG